MTDRDTHRRRTVMEEDDLTGLELPPEVDQALEEGLRRWAAEARLPSESLARIRRAVLADDPAYEPLTVQWWRRVLMGTTASVHAATDVRAFLQPAWGQR